MGQWDHLDEYSDNEDKVEEAPRVTRLDAPSRITFGGGSASVIDPQSSASTATGAPTSSVSTPSVVNEAWTQKGGLVTTSCNHQLYWCQDRDSVTLRFEVAEEEKIKSVQVQGVLSYADRKCAVGSTKPRLNICNHQSILLEGELPHQVHLAEEEEGIDWSVGRATQQQEGCSSDAV